MSDAETKNSDRLETADTFQSVALKVQESADMSFDDFVKTLLEALERLKEERSAFYEKLRSSSTKWANGSRGLLSLLGSIAFILTGVAAVLRFGGETVHADKAFLIASLAIYAVMGAISFYERGTDKTSAYFRHVSIILAIRDLWTKLQFQILKELMTLKSASDPTVKQQDSRERIRVLAEAFCNDLDKAATGEFTDWRTDFLASLSELAAAAKQGTADVTARIEDSIKSIEKSVASAKAASEKASAEAKAAAQSAEEAASPGGVNLSLLGEFEHVIVFVDGKEAVRTVGSTIALERISPGQRRISVQAKKGAQALEASVMVNIRPGLQDLQIDLR